MEIVKLENVSRVYTSGDHERKALDKVSLTLEEGKCLSVLQSGADFDSSRKCGFGKGSCTGCPVGNQND